MVNANSGTPFAGFVAFVPFGNDYVSLTIPPTLQPDLRKTRQHIKFQNRNKENREAWSYDMEGHARMCVERFCELAQQSVDQLHRVSTVCVDDNQIKVDDME